jgi:hypothetical protein
MKETKVRNGRNENEDVRYEKVKKRKKVEGK